ncbi:MAG: hypothetical protein ACYCYM_11905 [Saccharofermentanales bacterium]
MENKNGIDSIEDTDLNTHVSNSDKAQNTYALPIKKRRKKIGLMILVIVELFILLTGVAFAMSPEIRSYITQLFNPQSPQNTSGLNFEIDQVSLKSSSSQVSFSLKSTTDEKIKNNFRFKYLLICDQNDNVLIGIYNYVLNYNEVTDKTEVVFKSNYILENLGRKLTIKIIDLYYVGNTLNEEIKIPLNNILMTEPDFSPSYATGDNVIKKIGIIDDKSQKGTQEITSKLLYESTRKDLDNKSITFSVFNQNDELISRQENVYNFSNNESISTINSSGFALADIWEDPIETGGSITYPDGDLSNYYLKIEYADYIPYRNGEWEIDFIPTEGFDDYKYTKTINQSLKLELQNKSHITSTDIFVEKIEFTTSQTIATVKIDREIMDREIFNSFVSDIRIETAFDSYQLVKTIRLTDDSETGTYRIELVFPTVMGDRDPILTCGESGVEYISLDTTDEYIKFRQAIGHGIKMSIAEVKTYIENLKIPELVSTINNTFINKIANDEFGAYSVTELYDGTEIYIYNDTYDKIAAYYPKIKIYETIYDPSQIPVKPKGMTDEEWLEKKTVSDNLIRNCTPNSLDDLVKMFGTPNREFSTAPDVKGYMYRSNTGSEYLFTDNGIRFECLISNYYVFSRPSPKTMLKELNISGTDSIEMQSGTFKRDIVYYGAPVEKIIQFYGPADDVEGNNLFYRLSGGSIDNRYAIFIIDENNGLIELFIREDRKEDIQFENYFLESRPFPNIIEPNRKHDITEIVDLKYARTIEDVKHIWGRPFEEMNESVTVIKYELSDGTYAQFWSDNAELEFLILKSNSVQSDGGDNNMEEVFRRDCRTGLDTYRYIEKG